jgi:hypothetical protein
LVEAVNLVPDFLENLVSNNLLDAFSGSVIRVEPLCQRRGVRVMAERHSWDVTATYEDTGMSRAKGREQRPGLNALMMG